MVAVFEVVRGVFDNPPGIFLVGWSLLVSGIAMQSVSWALVAGGALLVGIVIGGAAKRA